MTFGIEVILFRAERLINKVSMLSMQINSSSGGFNNLLYLSAHLSQLIFLISHSFFSVALQKQLIKKIKPPMTFC